MKEKCLKGVVISAIVCMTFFCIIGAAENHETKIVKNLLKKRAFVMENVLSGRITYEAGKERLSKIESNHLYENDINVIQNCCTTDNKRLHDVEIIFLEKTSEMYDEKYFSGRINNIYSDKENLYTESSEYTIGVTGWNEEPKLIFLKQQ